MTCQSNPLKEIYHKQVQPMTEVTSTLCALVDKFAQIEGELEAPVETLNPFKSICLQITCTFFCGPNRAPRIGQPSHARNLRKLRKGPQVKTLPPYMQAKI